MSKPRVVLPNQKLYIILDQVYHAWIKCRYNIYNEVLERLSLYNELILLTLEKSLQLGPCTYRFSDQR